MHTLKKGSISEAVVLLALIRRGYTVSVPWGIVRYDFVIDDGAVLKKMQVKTGRIRKGCMHFNAYSISPDRQARLLYTPTEVDVFGVYCPDNDAVYLVPNTGVVSPQLRIDPPRHRGRKDGIVWASHFQVDAGKGNGNPRAS